VDVEAARSIEPAVLNYFEGRFDGDAPRMERALHPEHAKRDVVEGAVRTLTARQMIDAAAAVAMSPTAGSRSTWSTWPERTRPSSSAPPSIASTSTSCTRPTGGRS
jgi:hypothetical protein